MSYEKMMVTVRKGACCMRWKVREVEEGQG